MNIFGQNPHPEEMVKSLISGIEDGTLTLGDPDDGSSSSPRRTRLCVTRAIIVTGCFFLLLDALGIAATAWGYTLLLNQRAAAIKEASEAKAHIEVINERLVTANERLSAIEHLVSDKQYNTFYDYELLCYSQQSLARARQECKNYKFIDSKISIFFGSDRTDDQKIETVAMLISKDRNKKTTRILIEPVSAGRYPPTPGNGVVLTPDDPDFAEIDKRLVDRYVIEKSPSLTELYFANQSLARARAAFQNYNFENPMIAKLFGPPFVQNQNLEVVALTVYRDETGKPTKILVRLALRGVDPPILSNHAVLTPLDRDFAEIVRRLSLE